MATTISVDGYDGAILARDMPCELTTDEVLHPAGIHGQPGRKARQAIAGEPAGKLTVELSESLKSQGAIVVRVIESSHEHRLPEYTDVPIGRDIRLTAIGGVGENGCKGGDGERGLDGLDGMPASSSTDALNGADGGNGGAAGPGSHGAQGGSGGNVLIIIDENSTHLLMCVSWDVRGGAGGRAGEHGKPGVGGGGGIGGVGWQWEEIVGHKFFRTPRYINTSTYKQLDIGWSLFPAFPADIHAESRTKLSHIVPDVDECWRQTEFCTSGLLDIYAESRTELSHIVHDVYECLARTGHCMECTVEPIKQNFTRKPGFDGRDGEIGTAITDSLFPGLDGVHGTAKIVVQGTEGRYQEYMSPWALELVDFEVEDNHVDVGEYIHIRRVQVRNPGGMPTPTCQIPVRLGGHSDCFEAVDDASGGVAYLPTSILHGREATMQGSIKVRIRPNPETRALYEEEGWLAIRADVPWLDRTLPSFSSIRKKMMLSYSTSPLANVLIRGNAKGPSTSLTIRESYTIMENFASMALEAELANTQVYRSCTQDHFETASKEAEVYETRQDGNSHTTVKWSVGPSYRTKDNMTGHTVSVFGE